MSSEERYARWAAAGRPTSIRAWAVARPHRVGPWWRCLRCWVTGERGKS